MQEITKARLQACGIVEQREGAGRAAEEIILNTSWMGKFGVRGQDLATTNFYKFIQLLLTFLPISRAFIGNPLFPLSLEVYIHYLKDS